MGGVGIEDSTELIILNYYVTFHLTRENAYPPIALKMIKGLENEEMEELLMPAHSPVINLFEYVWEMS